MLDARQSSSRVLASAVAAQTSEGAERAQALSDMHGRGKAPNKVPRLVILFFRNFLLQIPNLANVSGGPGRNVVKRLLRSCSAFFHDPSSVSPLLN